MRRNGGGFEVRFFGRQADNLDPLGELLAERGRLDGGEHITHLALSPVRRRRYIVPVRQLERVQHTEDFVKIAPGGRWVSGGGCGDGR